MVRLVAGLAVLVIGVGAALLRNHLYSDPGTAETSGRFSSLLYGLIEDIAAPGEPADDPLAVAPLAVAPGGDRFAIGPAGAEALARAGVEAMPPAVSAQFPQIEQLLQELAAGQAAPGQPSPVTAPLGPAAIAPPQPESCPPDGSACPAVTGPASAAQVVVIRPRR